MSITGVTVWSTSRYRCIFVLQRELGTKVSSEVPIILCAVLAYTDLVAELTEKVCKKKKKRLKNFKHMDMWKQFDQFNKASFNSSSFFSCRVPMSTNEKGEKVEGQTKNNMQHCRHFFGTY